MKILLKVVCAVTAMLAAGIAQAQVESPTDAKVNRMIRILGAHEERLKKLEDFKDDCEARLRSLEARNGLSGGTTIAGRDCNCTPARSSVIAGTPPSVASSLRYDRAYSVPSSYYSSGYSTPTDAYAPSYSMPSSPYSRSSQVSISSVRPLDRDWYGEASGRSSSSKLTYVPSEQRYYGYATAPPGAQYVGSYRVYWVPNAGWKAGDPPR